jgi:hypothetical protein
LCYRHDHSVYFVGQAQCDGPKVVIDDAKRYSLVILRLGPDYRSNPLGRTLPSQSVLRHVLPYHIPEQ